MNDLHEWFQKNDLCPENILYLYRNDRKTVIHRMGKKLRCMLRCTASGLLCRKICF